MGFGEWPPPEQASSTPEQQERPIVPEHEIEIVFARGSGPGGQNANKRDTKAQLRWNVGGSKAFTDEQKAAIRLYAGNFLKQGDNIVMQNIVTRYQAQNRAAVIDQLQVLVAEALIPEKERKPTKVTRSQKEKRLDDKRREGDRKQNRRSPKGDW